MKYIINGNTLIVPEGVVKVGFKDVSESVHTGEIEEILLPESLEVIEDDAFFDCQTVKRINIPENVRQIGAQAFWGLDSLEELTISCEILHIGKHAFCNCPKLKLTVVGDDQALPEGWDVEFACNIGEIRYTANRQ